MRVEPAGRVGALLRGGRARSSPPREDSARRCPRARSAALTDRQNPELSKLLWFKTPSLSVCLPSLLFLPFPLSLSPLSLSLFLPFLPFLLSFLNRCCGFSGYCSCSVGPHESGSSWTGPDATSGRRSPGSRREVALPQSCSEVGALGRWGDFGAPRTSPGHPPQASEPLPSVRETAARLRPCEGQSRDHRRGPGPARPPGRGRPEVRSRSARGQIEVSAQPLPALRRLGLRGRPEDAQPGRGVEPPALQVGRRRLCPRAPAPLTWATARALRPARARQPRGSGGPGALSAAESHLGEPGRCCRRCGCRGAGGRASRQVDGCPVCPRGAGAQWGLRVPGGGARPGLAGAALGEGPIRGDPVQLPGAPGGAFLAGSPGYRVGVCGRHVPRYTCAVSWCPAYLGALWAVLDICAHTLIIYTQPHTNIVCINTCMSKT